MLDNNTAQESCHGCRVRYAGCHAECEIGKKYTAGLTAKNRATKAERDKDTYFIAYKVDRILETKRNAPGLNMRQRKANV